MRDAPRRIIDEIHQVGDFFIGKQLGIDLLDRPLDGKAGIKNKAERLFRGT